MGQPWATQRYRAVVADDEAALAAAKVRLATHFGRLRLPAYHGAAAGGGLAREPQAGGADLAPGRAEGAAPAAVAEATLVD